MPDVFHLSGNGPRISSAAPEIELSIAPDRGDDARASVLSRLAELRATFERDRGVLELLDERWRGRPVRPAPRTLAELVQSARERLANERRRDERGTLDARVAIEARLRSALEP